MRADNWKLFVRVCLHSIWTLDHGFVGGTERFILDLAKTLKRYGIETFVLCSNLTDTIEIEGVEIKGHVPNKYITKVRELGNDPVKFVSQELYGSTYSMERLARLSDYVDEQLDNVNYDIVHFNTLSASLSNQCRKNSVLSIHENPQELDSFWQVGAFDFLSDQLTNRTLLAPSEILAPSKYYADLYSKKFGRSVGYNAIGIPWTNIGDIIEHESSHMVKILLPSRFVPNQKGQDIIVDAAAKILEERSDFQITMTGALSIYQNHVDEIRSKISEKGLTKFFQIKLTNNIAEEFRNTHIVVSPERYCSYGISVREAIGLGIPTVLSDISPHLEIGNEFENVTYFESESPKHCADALLKMMQTKERSKLSTIRFRLKNDFDEFAKNYANIYLNLIQKST